MAADISAKIGIDGDRAFKDSIKAIDGELKALNAEMKAAVAEFDLMDEAEQDSAKKSQILNDAIDKQKEKLEILQDRFRKQSDELERLGEELEKAKREFGENSAEAEKAQKAYNNQSNEVNKLRTQIANTNKDISVATKQMQDMGKAVDDAGNDMAEATGKASIFGETLKGVLGAEVIKAGFSALAEGAKSAVGGIKEIVDAYADYEQLVGGVETLFGEAGQTKVMENAEKAFKTAGLSVNDYMETVTSFSASLISSLDGDTAKAAKVADQAIIDMSDNANKMGSSMESIQNAYSGFAKQNYTMLDNLKLGYGGTKSEMERLLADAGKLANTEFNIDSYSDVIEAIHVIQNEMGITGTTAKEAEATISGSLGMLSASFENLKIGLGDSNADIQSLIDDVVNSFSSVVENIQPVLEQIGNSLPEAVGAMMEAITPMLPQLIETGVQVLSQIVVGLLKAIPLVVQSAPEIIGALVDGLQSVFSELVNVGKEMLPKMIEGIKSTFQQLRDTASETIDTIKQSIDDKLSEIFDVGVNVAKGLWEGIKSMSSWLREQVTGWASGILDTVKNFFGIHSPSKVMEKQVGEQVANGVIKGVDNRKGAAKKSAEELGAVYVSSAKQKLKSLDETNQLTLAGEVAFWEAIKAQTQEGTKAYADANSALIKAKESLDSQLVKIEDTYQKDVSKITDKLVADINAVNNAYDQAVENRKNAIMSSMGLFDAFKADDGLSKGELTSNLQSQVDALKEWDATLDALGNRIAIPSDLLDELENIGVKSLNTLKQLNSMSDEELKSYVALYNDKAKIALERARTENAQLRAESDNQIKMLIEQAGANLQQLNQKYIDDLTKIGKDTQTESVTIGENIVGGMIAGINNRTDELRIALDELSQMMIATSREALDINSPSRKFRDIIGVNIPAGIAEGIKQNAQVAIDAVKDMSNGVIGIGESILATTPSITSQFDMQANLNEGLVNGLVASQSAQPLNMKVQLVLSNGQLIAEQIFDDLINVGKQRGVSLATA